MISDEAREESRRKIELLREPLVSAAFYHYFNQNWRTKELLTKLHSTGADIELLREWAIYSFHQLGKDEAEEKRRRSRMQSFLKKAIVGYHSAIEFYSLYASAPHHDNPQLASTVQRFKQLVEINQYLANQASEMRERAALGEVYTTKRLGVNWNASYLLITKMYLGKCTNWRETQILGTTTHLIAAAHKSVHRRIPRDLRALVRKAIRSFESDPRNANIIDRLGAAAASPSALLEMFPRLVPHPGQSAPPTPETK